MYQIEYLLHEFQMFNSVNEKIKQNQTKKSFDAAADEFCEISSHFAQEGFQIDFGQ